MSTCMYVIARFLTLNVSNYSIYHDNYSLFYLCFKFSELGCTRRQNYHLCAQQPFDLYQLTAFGRQNYHLWKTKLSPLFFQPSLSG